MDNHHTTPDISYSESMATAFTSWHTNNLPAVAVDMAVRDLTDMAGICVSARKNEYIGQLTRACDDHGPCTAIGHARGFNAAGAALINGTATHGEDFDDTLEGAPIRVGAMIIPAVLAAGERYQLSGERVITGIVVGMEAVCRLNHVAAGYMHKACFHPVGVIGALGASMGVGAALSLDAKRLSMAMGVAGSFSSGIIEFLTDGAWTKRIHPGWAAQSGLNAALIARQGFFAPRTILEGGHSFFKAFAPTATPDYSHLVNGLGDDFYMSRLAFKPYACGTMIHPYIDCMIELAEQGVSADDIKAIRCPTGEGLVHRLWEPLSGKQKPPSGYAAKFSMPYCMAVGFYDRDAGLGQFTDQRVSDPKLLELAAKIDYEIDPDNAYPRNYSGHIRVTLKNGEAIAIDRPWMRGGQHEPLSAAELRQKFNANIEYGGWNSARGDALFDYLQALPTHPNLTEFKQFGSE